MYITFNLFPTCVTGVNYTLHDKVFSLKIVLRTQQNLFGKMLLVSFSWITCRYYESFLLKHCSRSFKNLTRAFLISIVFSVNSS